MDIAPLVYLALTLVILAGILRARKVAMRPARAPRK